jgi:hypothetical protein
VLLIYSKGCGVFFIGFLVTIQPSGFAAKKQTIFRQTSLLFEGDAAHRLKKEAQDGGKAAFFAQNGNGLNSYFLSYPSFFPTRSRELNHVHF